MIGRTNLSARAPVILLVLALLYVGALGLASTDFGSHWDESSITGSVQKSFATGLLLPRWYNYPSVPYDVAMLAAFARTAVDPSRSFDPTGVGLGAPAFVTELGGIAFLLQLRAIFFLLSLGTGLAVFLLVRRLSGSGWIALFAALMQIDSFEFLYHARWIAPDCLVALFAAFSLWAQHRMMDPTAAARRPVWMAVASLFAGLCAGSKYPGGLVLVPLLIARWLAPREKTARRFAALRESALAAGIALLTFVLVTPGAVLEPMRLLIGVTGEMIHYAEGHGGYTVLPGWDHFSRLATYLGLVLLSNNVVLAATATAVALAGVAVVLRTRPRTAAWLLALPILYVAYMSRQRVMIVRNDLILLPFFAIFGALGLAALLRAAGDRRVLRYPVIAGALALIGYNLIFATTSSLSIASPSTVTKATTLERRLASAPGTKFFLSPRCRALIAGDAGHRPVNVVDSIAAADRFIFDSAEVSSWTQLAANKRGRYRTVWSRMQEVNWDYYPSWPGNPRLLEVSAHAVNVH